MASIYRHLITFPCKDGFSQDRITNTLYSVNANDAAAIGFAADITTLFTTLGTGQTDEISAYFGPTIDHSANACTVTTYDMADATPRVPIDTPITFTCSTGSSGAALPREAALCVSFKGDPTSGVNPQSQRGRIFLGGLNQNAGTTDTPTGDLRPTTQFLDDCAIAFGEFNITETPAWVVYSSTLAATYTVTSGWIDNAFDTQRRRGVDPTTRVTF